MAKTIQQYETTMILNTKKGEDGINALVEKFSVQEVRDAVVKGFDLKSLLGITMTYVFKDLLILGGVIDVLPTYFEHLPIPAFLVLVILYAFGTLVAGSSAAAAAFIPLAYTMIPDGGAFLLTLLMNVSFASSQLSPTHISRRSSQTISASHFSPRSKSSCRCFCSPSSSPAATTCC